MTPMVVQCSSCLTEFELDPHKVPVSGVRARCSVCSAVITVPQPPQERAQQNSEQRAEQRAEQGGEQRAATPSAQTNPSTQSAPAPERSEPERVSGASADRTAASGESVAPPLGAAAEDRPAAAPTATVASEGPSATPGGATPAGGVSRRPINPFLSRDPALRAKRLARALVSDIVAYHPARHAEGLREGTLKTLFRDEIKKSYEEYVDQVGRDFASSTTHFQDALNDVLAGGKKLF